MVAAGSTFTLYVHLVPMTGWYKYEGAEGAPPPLPNTKRTYRQKALLCLLLLLANNTIQLLKLKIQSGSHICHLMHLSVGNTLLPVAKSQTRFVHASLLLLISD